MKKLLYFLLFCLFLMILGRNLSFLPRFDFESQEKKTGNLKNKIEKFLSGKNGIFSVYYKDLKTGSEFGINENMVLTGASVNKLYIASYFYHLAKNKKINPEENIIIQNEDLQDYGTGSLRYDGDGKQYSLKSLVQFSLKKSDNTAAYLLGLKLGMDNIQKYIKDLGLSSTNMVDNKTTAKEAGRMLEMIYNNKITGEVYKNEFLDFLKDTDFEDRLPKYLKNNTLIYHKTGDAQNKIHDVGIIVGGKNIFILSVLTSDVIKEQETKDAIGKIAEIISNEKLKEE